MSTVDDRFTFWFVDKATNQILKGSGSNTFRDFIKEHPELWDKTIQIQARQHGYDKVILGDFTIKKPIDVNPQPGGDIDINGIQWLAAKGKQTLIKQSRDQADDDRWSANVTGLGKGYEATMIAKSIDTSSGAHFASKLFGGNHSGDGSDKQRWYDLGLRLNGDVQLQWEGPHPSNHSFTLPSSKQFIKNIGKGLEGNHIGLKWCVQKVNGQQNGSPENGGVRVRMWADSDPLDANGKPKNGWKLVCDFIDGVDLEVIQPQTFSAPDEIDVEIRRSNTKTHVVYAGGQHVRAL